MALKFQKSNNSGIGTGGTYDHSLLVNRGLPDQHTIESITGLREALNRKYEKPISGIPKSDLAFDVATLTDIDNLRKTDITLINNQISLIVKEIVEARGDEATLKDYIDTKVSFADWSGAGGVGNSSGEIGYPLLQRFFATEGQTLFVFTEKYEMGSNQLEVYLNGILMDKGTDYEETTENSIEFLYELEKDDLVKCMVRAVITSGLHEEYVASAAQTLFTLQAPYAIYQNTLQVYLNGVLQRKGRDYRELNDITIEFYKGLVNGDLVTFHQAGSTDPIAGVILESEVGRLKISNAQLSLSIQEVTGVENVNMIDMYVDTFLSTNRIDHDKSLDFVHTPHQISTGEVCFVKDTEEEFSEGSAAGTNVTSLHDRIVLANNDKGSEVHDFVTPVETVKQKHKITESIRIAMADRSEFLFWVEQDTANKNYLIVTHTVYDTAMVPKSDTLSLTDVEGEILNLDFAKTKTALYVVYTVKKADGSSAVFFLEYDGQFNPPKQVTEYNYAADNPSIDVWGDNLFIAFQSKRVNANTFNIDYVTRTGGTWSGINHIVSESILPSLHPSVAYVDGVPHIAFSSLIYNGINYNLILAKVEGGVISTVNVTRESHDNMEPQMATGSADELHITWLSKRLNANFGVDIATVYPNGDISGTRTVFASTTSIVCRAQKMTVDHFGNVHVVLSANEKRPSIDNVIYAYMQPGGTIVDYKSIVSHATETVRVGAIDCIYDKLYVSANSTERRYTSEKSIANYTASGFYMLEVDSYSDDTTWKDFDVVEYLPTGTSVSYRLRASNDRLSWSEWIDAADVSKVNLKGRYIAVDVHLSGPFDKTPEVYKMSFTSEPSVIFVQTKKIPIDKDIQNCIVIAKYEGNAKFLVSKDGGRTFTGATLDRSTNLLTMSSTQELVLRVELERGAVLDSWALIW